MIKKTLSFLGLSVFVFAALHAGAEDKFIVYEGKEGPGKGKHVVLLSGDEEYRSEEAMPMLGKILAERHGFKCTVLFSINKDGFIDPNTKDSLPGSEALATADVIVTSLRFRAWPDAEMKNFVDAYLAGKSIIGLRTSTHAFNGLKGEYAKYNNGDKTWAGGFGKQVLGEQWVSHWGGHKSQATRGVIEEANKADPILRGVTDVFGDSDVYEAKPPADVKILMRGAVLKGMKPTDEALEGKKNDPMMPVVWTRLYKNESGKENKILCTTLGAATDLLSEGLRRIVVNGVYWGAGLEVPEKADVTYVDDFKPLMYGFNGYRAGLKPSDHAIGKVLPEGTKPVVAPKKK